MGRKGGLFCIVEEVESGVFEGFFGCEGCEEAGELHNKVFFYRSNILCTHFLPQIRNYSAFYF